jgi:hypothetical protein
MNTNPPLRAARYYEIRISRSEREGSPIFGQSLMDTIGARVPLRLAELMARDENRNAAVAAARTLEELTERENAPGRAGRSIPQAPGLVIVVCPPMPTVQGPQAP